MAAGQPTDSSIQLAAAAAKAVAGPSDSARAAYRRMIQVIEADGRWPVEAFRFLQEGLEFTVRRVHGESAMDEPIQTDAAAAKGDPRHVTGPDLCRGLRRLALDRWGRLSPLVLNAWGVFNTRDFGEMVFVLVDNGFLQKTDNDRVDDFAGVYALSDLERQYVMACDALHDDGLLSPGEGTL